MKNVLLILIIGLSFGLVSCGGGDEEKPVNVYNYDRADSLSTEYTKEVVSIRGNIKETSGFYFALRNDGAEYNSTLPISPSKSSSFSTTTAKCIGMGIYGADLNYITVFGQNDVARTYVDGISKLADELGIEKAYDKELFEQIVSESDTIGLQKKSNLVSKAFRNAEDQMYNEERALYATLMVSGGWVESVYLTSHLILDNKINTSNISDYWLLCNNYFTIMKMLHVFEDNADAKAMLEKLTPLEGSIKKITENPSITYKGIQGVEATISKVRKTLI